MFRIFLRAVVALFRLVFWAFFLFILFLLTAVSLSLFVEVSGFAFMFPAVFACLWGFLFVPSLAPDLRIIKDFIERRKRRLLVTEGNAAEDPNLSLDELFPFTGTKQKPQMPDMVFQVIAYDSNLYQQAVRLREAVLRARLGLTFTQAELAAEKDHLHIVGVRGERVCACAVLVPEGQAMKMQRVAVAEDLQGQGIGGAMMKFCERLAADHGAEKVYVHARDTAVPFYEKNGYVAEGEMFDEDGIPHLKMWKPLSIA